MYRVSLTQRQFKMLMTPVARNAGGFQALLDDLQADSAGFVVTIKTESLANRIVDYVDRYGRGGYQNRLRPLADFIKQQQALRAK